MIHDPARPVTSALREAARYVFFGLSVLCIALGVSLSTAASLGTSPISAIPYSLSLCIQGISFGSCVIAFNLLLVGAEWLMLREKLGLTNLAIQVALAFLFGYCIDMFMYFLAASTPQVYWLQVLMVLSGCFVMAIGICLGIRTRISLLPGDGFVQALATVTNMEFGRIRMLSDIAMSVAGIIICMTTLGNLAGVREGTAIAAFATGYFVLLLMKGCALCRCKRR